MIQHFEAMFSADGIDYTRLESGSDFLPLLNASIANAKGSKAYWRLAWTDYCSTRVDITFYCRSRYISASLCRSAYRHRSLRKREVWGFHHERRPALQQFSFGPKLITKRDPIAITKEIGPSKQDQWFLNNHLSRWNGPAIIVPGHANHWYIAGQYLFSSHFGEKMTAKKMTEAITANPDKARQIISIGVNLGLFEIELLETVRLL